MKIPNKCDGNRLKINARHEAIDGTGETHTVSNGTAYDMAFCQHCGLAFIQEHEHEFVTKRQGGSPADAGSDERVRVCSSCGAEEGAMQWRYRGRPIEGNA